MAAQNGGRTALLYSAVYSFSPISLFRYTAVGQRSEMKRMPLAAQQLCRLARDIHYSSLLLQCSSSHTCLDISWASAAAGVAKALCLCWRHLWLFGGGRRPLLGDGGERTRAFKRASSQQN